MNRRAIRTDAPRPAPFAVGTRLRYLGTSDVSYSNDAGDFIRFDGALHRVRQRTRGVYQVDGPHAALIGEDEFTDADVLLESEGFDEFERKRSRE